MMDARHNAADKSPAAANKSPDAATHPHNAANKSHTAATHPHNAPDKSHTAAPDEWSILQRHFSAHVPGLMDARSEYAVLCPLVKTPDGLCLLYEVRAAGIRQGGEVCFPGGRMESGESDIVCALRETREELSIPPEEIHVIGRTDFICNQRGFLLHPVLGLISARGMEQLNPSAAEVSDVFTVPIRFFRQTPPAVYAYELSPVPPENFPYAQIGVPSDYPWSTGRVEVPVWYWNTHAIWGMTARITRSLIQVFQSHPE